MRPAAAAQWTDLGKDHLIEYEIARADRIEVQFRQGDWPLRVPPEGLTRSTCKFPVG